MAQTQLGHSSIRTTEKYYTHFSPEFAVSRTREVMEQRGRYVGDTDPEPEPDQDEAAESPEDDYEPATPSTGRTGTQVVPGGFGSGVPSTARLDTKLLTEADERPSAG